MSQSFYAENIYWMFRYWSRAEYIATVIYHYDLLLMDANDPVIDHEWKFILHLFADNNAPLNLSSDSRRIITQKIKNFLLWDASNPASLLQIVKKSHHNAKLTRGMIHSTLWIIMNKAYVFIDEIDHESEKNTKLNFFQFFYDLNQCMYGYLENHVSHTGYYHLIQLASTLERGFQLSKTLLGIVNHFDIKKIHQGNKIDQGRLGGFLLSLFHANEEYLKFKKELSLEEVIDFMLTNRFFPQTLTYLLQKMKFHIIALVHLQSQKALLPIEKQINLMLSATSFDIDLLNPSKLHEYFTKIIALFDSLNRLIEKDLLFNDFFYYGDVYESDCRTFL
jgi:uncharacterized alpha-E superfamily protein